MKHLDSFLETNFFEPEANLIKATLKSNALEDLFNTAIQIVDSTSDESFGLIAGNVLHQVNSKIEPLKEPEKENTKQIINKLSLMIIKVAFVNSDSSATLFVQKLKIALKQTAVLGSWDQNDLDRIMNWDALTFNLQQIKIQDEGAFDSDPAIDITDLHRVNSPIDKSKDAKVLQQLRWNDDKANLEDFANMLGQDDLGVVINSDSVFKFFNLNNNRDMVLTIEESKLDLFLLIIRKLSQEGKRNHKIITETGGKCLWIVLSRHIEGVSGTKWSSRTLSNRCSKINGSRKDKHENEYTEIIMTADTLFSKLTG